MSTNTDFAARMRANEQMTLKDKLEIIYHLSLPGILAQISEIIMQYIDAAMVGVLGASASASIGLVSSSTWLFNGVVMATAAGFSVQVAHAVGAGKTHRARSIFKQSIISSLLLSAILCVIGIVIGSVLPQMLGADPSIWKDASAYFTIFAMFIPIRQLNTLLLNMLQCSGNMKVPSVLSAVMCGLDVIFNYLLSFSTRTGSIVGMQMTMPGAGMGVAGAQLGTSLSVLCCTLFAFYAAGIKSPSLCLKGLKGNWLPDRAVLKEAVHIGLPMAFEQTATSGAQVVSMRIVAPLGTIAIAANSFAVTAESICYMPGYGIANAATTMVGQAVGAKRKDLARSFAWLVTFTGMAVMTVTGVLMYAFCPYVFAFLTPDTQVQALGVSVLRIELLAEPMFAASIEATGALRGAGDTFMPGMINLVSIWGIRITMAYVLSGMIGLSGVWIAMAVELTFRGILMLIRLKREKWLANLG